MALHNMPQGSTGEDIKPRIEYDAKAGRWHRVDRTQGATGWVSDKFEMVTGTMFIADFANIEVGWISFSGTSGPDFRMVPNGQDVGPRPSDAHKAGFRLNVLLPKEEGPRTFASTAKAVINVIDELHTMAEAQGQPGMVPVMKIAGTRVIETKSPAGVNRNYAPLLEIVKWTTRPAALGAAKAAPVLTRATPQPAIVTAPAGAPIDDEIPF